jgi:hypothetical protein
MEELKKNDEFDLIESLYLMDDFYDKLGGVLFTPPPL